MVGDKVWIFPVMKPSPSLISPFDYSQTFRLLLLLGEIMTPLADMYKDHSNYKLKDIIDMENILKHDESVLLLAVNRVPDYFEIIMGKFPHQTFALREIDTARYVETINTAPYIWIPITKNSSYMTGVFTSTISVGLAFRKVLIMPRHLSKLFGLNGAVVEYQESICEVDFDAINHVEILRRLDAWVRARSIQNTINFVNILNRLL